MIKKNRSYQKLYKSCKCKKEQNNQSKLVLNTTLLKYNSIKKTTETIKPYKVEPTPTKTHF